MSKENTNDGILEETSSQSQTLEDTTNLPSVTPPTTEKTLEEIENERLQAISQGELPETSINYGNYVNKPNKVVDNVTATAEDESSPLDDSGVRKIDSRPDRHTRKRKRRRKPKTETVETAIEKATETTESEGENLHVKIDSKSEKAKSEVEATAQTTAPTATHVDTDEEFGEKLDLSEKFKAVKEKRSKSLLQTLKESTLELLGVNTAPIDISATFNLAKARRAKQIDELNANLPVTKVSSKPSKLQNKDKEQNQEQEKEQVQDQDKVIEETPKTPEVKEVSTPNPNALEPPKVEITQTIVTKNIKKELKKNSLKNRIENFFFMVEEVKIDDEESVQGEQSEEKEKKKFRPFHKVGKPKEPTEDVTLESEISKDEPKPEKVSFKEFLNKFKKSKSTDEVDVDETPKVIEETPSETDQEPKPKFNLKTYTKNLFLGDETSKDEQAPKESFKQRMLDFFFPIEEERTMVDLTPPDDTEETPQSTAETVEPIVPPVVEKTEPIVPPVVEKAEPIVPPVVEKTEPIVPPVVEKAEPIVPPVVEKTEPIVPPNVEPTVEKTEPVETLEPTKKLSLYRRVKNFFLSEEITHDDSTDEVTENVTETPTTEPVVEKVETVEPVTETEPIVEPKVEKVENVVETPVIADESQTVEKVETVEPVTETEPIVEPSVEKVAEPEKLHEDDENLILPFNEDTPSEAIDIPLEEPPHYDHFWQDPDFSIVDRFKEYREKYKSRKRSGDFHVEIKSTPDTEILFEDLERKIIAHEELTKSREEYRKQVANGEYDGFEENPPKTADDEEPVFHENSVADYNSYEETETIGDYIADMKNSLMVRMVITTLTAIISFYITIANDLELPLPDTLNATVSASGYLFVQSVLGLLTILASVKAVFSGVAKIFKGKSDCDSLASMGLVTSFIATVLAYVSGQKVVEDRILNVYMCLGIIGMLCNLWGKNLILKREEHNFKYISKEKDKCGLYCMQDYSDAESITEGLVDGCPVTAYNKKANFTTDFVKYTYSRDMADKFAQVATPVIAVLSLFVAIIAGIVYNKTFESQIPVAITSIFSMLVSFCSCFSLGINLNSMLNRVSEKYPRREGALLGYQAVEDFYDTNSMVLSASDVFPDGSVELCAMKLFSGGKLDETLIYAISLAKDSNSILAPTLMKIVEDKTDYLRKVESYTYEDGKGLCGWIDSKRILMGNRELMEAHNVENLPTKSKEAELVGKGNDAVYVSVSGNLALMFVVKVTTHKEVERFLQTFEENNVSIALTSIDFLVSVERVSTLYDLEPESLKIIPYSVYQDNKVYFEDKPQCSSSIVTSGNVNILANLLVLTKKIHRNALIGNILYAVACILGILIGISFITMGAFKELNPTMILFYNGVCTLITILLTKLKI